jgi:uncharacterized protein YutE (UPF0331/DUF86 family)
VVRPDVAGRKVARAARWLDDAEAILSRDSEELARDAASRDLAAFYLFLAIQECIDLAAHWVADDGLAPPEDASSAFDVLAERGFIEPETADALRAAAGLRNRIAHGYGDIDLERVRAEAKDGVKCLREFLVAVSNAAGL